MWIESTVYWMSFAVLFKFTYFYFMCITVCLHVCTCAECVPAVHRSQKTSTDPSNWSCIWWWATMWMLVPETTSFTKQQVLLTTNPFLSSCPLLLFAKPDTLQREHPASHPSYEAQGGEAHVCTSQDCFPPGRCLTGASQKRGTQWIWTL